MMKDLIKKLVSKLNRYVSAKIIFAFDLLISTGASAFSLALLCLTYGIRIEDDRMFFILWIAGAFLYSAIAFIITDSYRIIIRHSGLKELSNFVIAALIKDVLLFLTCFFLSNQTLRNELLLALGDFVLTVFLLMIVRIGMVVLYDSIKDRLAKNAKRCNVLIYGTSEKSVSAKTRLINSPDYKVIGFAIYGETPVEHTLAEKKVYYIHNTQDILYLQENTKANAILFTSEEDIKGEKERIVRFAVEAHMKVLFSPSINEVKDGKVETIHSIRNIEIEDLLGREEIRISLDEIKQDIHGKTVLVTGAAGSIGSELCRQLASFGVGTLVLYDNAETPMHNIRLELEEKFPDLNFIPLIGDVRLKARLDFAFRKWRPQIVFHAAAYKHVPLMEENPCEAVLVNVIGSRNVADKCIEYGCEKMVMISTDKAVNPTNIMGCTKRLAEIYTQALSLAIKNGTHEGNTIFVTTRFGNVLGSNGSVIPRFREQIAKGGPVTVTHPDITRFFMTIPEACRLVLEAANMSTGGQIFVFDMGDSVKIDYLARRMISLAGFEPDKDIRIVYSGLRPGEKLYEEVLASTEDTVPTEHTRIKIAKVREYDYSFIRDTVCELESLSRNVDIPEMVRLMKKTVPEYRSENSPYQVYDKTDGQEQSVPADL